MASVSEARRRGTGGTGGWQNILGFLAHRSACRLDFLNATKGHSVVLNFSTIPAWMFKTPKPVVYPSDPDQVTWDYTQGNELRDPTGKELGDYFARLVSWYVSGGFTDEYGKRHDSGHHFSIPYWEVLNEPDFEHNTTAEQYTARYDAIVAAIHKVSPSTKFVGVSLAIPNVHPEVFEYFLNRQNHQPRTPLDMISYHFYAIPTPDQSPDVQQYTFFTQADGFLDTVGYIEAIRNRLSPETGTTVNEIGCISADDLAQNMPGHVTKDIVNSYWNHCCPRQDRPVAWSAENTRLGGTPVSYLGGGLRFEVSRPVQVMPTPG